MCAEKKSGWDVDRSGAVLQARELGSAGGDEGRQRRAWSGSGCAARASSSGGANGSCAPLAI